MGFSGVQTVPNSLQSLGRFTPRRIAPHSQPLWSGTERPGTAKRRSASKAAKASLMRRPL